jgi:N-acetylmuramoyl-L-alanine amidase
MSRLGAPTFPAVCRRRAARAGVVALMAGLTLSVFPGSAPAAVSPQPVYPQPVYPQPVYPQPVSPSPASSPPRASVAAGGVDVPVAGASSGDGRGLWIASTSGAVADEGDAPAWPDRLGASAVPVIDITATPSGKGYWLLGADGRVHSYGSAGYHGSIAVTETTTQPVVAMASTPDGRGYWLVGRLGRVSAFGDARYDGGAARDHLSQPVVSIAAAPQGNGYWIVGRSGRVINVGDAGFYGSANHLAIGSPIVDMVATPSGRGYWLADRDGRVYGFGRATVYGSATRLDAPVINLARTADGRGYWLLLANGTVRAFGDARSVRVRRVASNGYSLVGQVVTLDPGHNGHNYLEPAYIAHLVPSGPDGMKKACDTTGTETDSGYTEAAFNFDVVTRLATALRDRGATVVLTRKTNTGVGPCVNQRAAIGNKARSDVALSVHADGGPPGGRGFTVLLPARFPGYNDAIVPPSDRLGGVLRNAFGAVMPISDYYGTDGLQVRDDLGGLNLSTVPKVLIECGNMRNSTDATLLTSPTWRQRAAEVLAVGLTDFLLTVPA